MSNTHGHLPKAERAQLPAELQQRLEAWTTKAYTDDNLFLTLARSPGVLEMFLHWAAFMYTGISRTRIARQGTSRGQTAVILGGIEEGAGHSAADFGHAPGRDSGAQQALRPPRAG
jgi:hypothetical protein